MLPKITLNEAITRIVTRLMKERYCPVSIMKLSRFSGVSNAMLQSILKGRKQWGLLTLTKIAPYLGVTIEELTELALAETKNRGDDAAENKEG